MPIDNGDFVIIAKGKKHRWLIQVEEGKEFHNHFGIVYHDDLLGKEFGDIYESLSSHAQFILVKPLMHEMATKFARGTQIIYPKDIGFIILNAGIVPGSRVLEAGTGSGAMTMLIGSIVNDGGSGKVISYDIVEKHHQIAKKNIIKARLSNIVDLRMGNVTERGVQEELSKEDRFDACIFDLPKPWDVVDLAHQVLKPCGVFCSFSPVIEQIKKTALKLREGKWYDVNTFELLLRAWQVKENATRPKPSMTGHTGFIVVAKKINVKPPMEWNRDTRKDLAKKLKDEGDFDETYDGEAINLFDD
ncbi:MAG: tRNA (adenine-N1)-methyltransferase [Candidatus Hodarchaeota archaeon]